MLEKTDVEGYFKDKKTGAIINGDVGQASIYRKQKQFYRDFENMKATVLDMQAQIKELQQTVEELKRK